MTTQLYTSSRLRVLRECLRKHYYRYVLGLQTDATPAMRFGTIGHAALEAWYRAWMAYCTTCEGSGERPFSDSTHGGDDTSCSACPGIGESTGLEDRLPAALSVLDDAELSPFDRAKLRVLVIAYHERWGSRDWEILAVEQEFRYYLGSVEIGGKIDAIIRDRADGRVYVVEHKFTGADASLGAPYWERLTIDTQVSIYIDGAAMLGHDVAGCIYDVLKRPAHEPKMATPVDRREYTKGKGCKRCGGSAKPGAIEQGRGYYTVSMVTVEDVPCPDCKGTGWKCDADGNPQAPRLHSNQRDTDEPVDDFEARLVEAIAENPDAFLLRGVVVRLDDELPVMRQDILDDISLAETGLTQRNSNSCAHGSAMCGYFALCSGTARIDDFTRGPAHPELAAT